ncbi:MAG: transcription termination/antitermination protein NusG, partial [Candidatus Acidiferrales bacterium]
MNTYASIYSDSLVRPVEIIPDGSWYAIQTFPRHEKAVATRLAMDGIECLLPLTVEERKWSDRRKRVSVPLFPGYIFLQLFDYDLERLDVLHRPGVVRFVGNRRETMSIPFEEIQGIRRLMENKISCRPHPFLAEGQRVRVRTGALEGLEGILVRVNENESVVLSVRLIQRSLAIRVEGYDLE